MANSGQEHTMSDVFVAVVKSMAAFSVRKYKDPPNIPNKNIMNSSRHDWLKSRNDCLLMISSKASNRI